MATVTIELEEFDNLRKNLSELTAAVQSRNVVYTSTDYRTGGTYYAGLDDSAVVERFLAEIKLINEYHAREVKILNDRIQELTHPKK